jgi:hypothetical protein
MFRNLPTVEVKLKSSHSFKAGSSCPAVAAVGLVGTSRHATSITPYIRGGAPIA